MLAGDQMWIECAREAAAAAAAVATDEEDREFGVEEDGFIERFSGMSSSGGTETSY